MDSGIWRAWSPRPATRRECEKEQFIPERSWHYDDKGKLVRGPDVLRCKRTMKVIIIEDDPKTKVYRAFMKLRRGQYVADTDWKQLWDSYLRSTNWQQKRVDIIRRSGGWCESCKREAATEVDHLTYKNRFRERPGDLMAVCGPCHRRLSLSRGQVKPSNVYGDISKYMA